MTKTRLAVALLFVLGVATFFAAGGQRALTIEVMQAKYGDLEALYAAHPAATVGAFFAAYVLVATSSLPGGAVLTMLAGALFGPVNGTLVVSFASSLGALLAMLLSRYVLREWIRERFGPRLGRLDEGIERDGALYLFMVRLVPAIPFFLVNAGAGLTRMPAWRYYWVSQLGMLPGSLVFAHAGRRFAEVDSPQDVLSPGVVGALVLLAALVYGSRKLVAGLRKRRSESARRR